MKLSSIFSCLFVASGLLLSACSDNNLRNDYISQATFDLGNSDSEWQSGFSDYPIGGETEWELTATANQQFDLSSGEVATGYYLHSHNRSDDTQMYITRQLSGLKPGQHYNISLNLDLATNVNSDCVGIGGAPHAVTIKAGLTQQQPAVSPDNLDHYRLNIDFGNQTQGGLDGLALGDIGEDSLSDCDPGSQTYAIKTFNNNVNIFEATADDEGKLWLTLLTDSGFEGPTSIYFTAVEVTFSESEKSIEGFTESIDYTTAQPNISSVFFDYPAGREFEWELTATPLSTVTLDDEKETTGYLLHSYNRSDDTGMLLFKAIKGLAANTEYTADVELNIASNVNDQCFGIGGAPHSVAVKAGISTTEPAQVLPADDNHYRLNQDFGNQMSKGEFSIVLGDIGVASLADCDPGSEVFALKGFSSDEAGENISFTTDSSGIAYFSMFTDSGFEGQTTVLFTQASVTFTKL